MALRRKSWRRVENYVVIYDSFNDAGKLSRDEKKIITARNAADAAVMFDFWARGEMKHWGCEILPRQLLLHIEDIADDAEHPENKQGVDHE